MQITEHVHALKIPFRLMVREGMMLDRFVYAYLIYGKEICLIDCGVSSSHTMIYDYIKGTGRDPREITRLIFTHSHPDHIGCGPTVQRETGCRAAAHVAEKGWIEDVACQFRERPILNFHDLVEGPVRIDRELKDGDIIDLGEDRSMKVIHTPGHSKGSISLFYEEEGTLFTADALPMGGVPIYEDVPASMASIRKLKGLKGLKVLLASWDEPHYGDQIDPLIDEGMQYFQKIHEVVRNERGRASSETPEDVAAAVIKALGLPEVAMIPIVIRSVAAHLQVIDKADLL
jgi:hydroxyacylglutathione hydrolase